MKIIQTHPVRPVAQDVMSSLISKENAMIIRPKVFDVLANENVRYKLYELEIHNVLNQLLSSSFFCYKLVRKTTRQIVANSLPC